MPTGRTDELTGRFGPDAAEAISRAYEAAISAATEGGSLIPLDTDQRLQLVSDLIAEVEAGRSDPAQLKKLALIFVSQQLGSSNVNVSPDTAPMAAGRAVRP